MAIEAKRKKPEKPYPGFPLTAHGCGQWCKFIKGRTYYFGPWEDAETALAVYRTRLDDIMAGVVKGCRVTFEREQQTLRGQASLTLSQLVNEFMGAKDGKVETGELRPATFAEYFRVCEELLKHLGRARRVATLTPSDFTALRLKLARGVDGDHLLTLGELGKRIQIVRMVFLFGKAAGLHPEVNFGPGFRRPDRKALRKAKAKAKRESGGKKRMFTAEEIRLMLDHAKPVLRAMILLGINGGMGNTDLAEMPRSAVDLKNGWVEYPRPKNGVERRFPLWPETVEALKAGIPLRPAPRNKEDEHLVFLTKYGHRWSRFKTTEDETGTFKKGCWIDGLSQELGKLMKSLDIDQSRKFYAFRHTFRTVTDDLSDRPMVDLVMGHERLNDMRQYYVEETSEERLQRVVWHVHHWLYPACPWPR